MELISHGLAELLRPVIALLVKGLFAGVVLLLTAPVVILRFLHKKMNEGLGGQDRLRVSRFLDNKGHREPRWKKCRECVEFVGLVKSARAISKSVAGEVMDVEMFRRHRVNDHKEPAWADCRECLEYMEQSGATLRQALIQLTAEGIAEAVMCPFHTESSHQEPS